MAWLAKQSNHQSPKIDNDFPSSVSGDEVRLFEYLGEGSFHIQGPYSGNNYSFTFTGDQQPVHSNDAYAFMGEDQLRIVKTA